MSFADVQWVVFVLAALLLALLAVARRQQTRLEERLRYQVLHDPLTGLANRSLLLYETTKAVKAGQKPSGAAPVLLFLDLDDFKLVNDTLGHGAGDALLKEIALRLEEVCAEEGIVARLGGDEFAVLFSGEDPAEPLVVAERLLRSFGGLRPLGTGFSLSASIGIARGADTTTAEELLRRADVAMYAAKADGKATVRTFEPTMDEAMRFPAAGGYRHAERAGCRSARSRQSPASSSRAHGHAGSGMGSATDSP